MTPFNTLSGNASDLVRRSWPREGESAEAHVPRQFSLRAFTIVVAVVAVILAWAVSLRASNAGWMIIPAALGFAIFVGQRLKGWLGYKVTVGGLFFFGACCVGAYATALARYWLGMFEPRDLAEAVAPFGFVVLLPGVLVVAFLLVRAFVVALNSKG